jgi:hypothetical protein
VAGSKAQHARVGCHDGPLPRRRPPAPTPGLPISSARQGVLLSPVLDDALGSRTAVRRVQVEDHLVHPLVQQCRRLVEVPEAGVVVDPRQWWRWNVDSDEAEASSEQPAEPRAKRQEGPCQPVRSDRRGLCDLTCLFDLDPSPCVFNLSQAALHLELVPLLFSPAPLHVDRVPLTGSARTAGTRSGQGAPSGRLA